MKSLLVALLLLTAAAARFQHYEAVARDAGEFDLLYSASSGPVNETWYFGDEAIWTSVIMPSQVNLCASGSSTNATYEEAIDLLVYETRKGRSSSYDDTYLVATGSFTGTVGFGQELAIPLWNATLQGAPPVHEYSYSYDGFEYTLSIAFRKSGTYPWYTVRNLSDYSPVSNSMAEPGIAIGLSFIIS